MHTRWYTILLALLLLLGVTACSVLPARDSTTETQAGATPQATMPTPYPPPPGDVPTEIKAIWEVWNILVNEHVARGALNTEELKEAAIQGMLDLVDDPYASYLDPDGYRLEAHSLSGTFEGIGAEVTLRNNRLLIVAPLPNTPAEEAGIRPGDVVLAVDNVTTEGMSLRDAILRIRGPKGTRVTLLVRHFGETDPQEITIVRRVITVQSVRSNMMDDGIGYIGLQAFSDNTNERLTQILEEMKAQGVRGIVLDLRNNPGGLVSATVDVASQFLREGLVLYEVDGTGKRTNLEVRGNPMLPDTPLVVLVNGHSASGSEVLAGALQDHGRALLVGTETFGKGSVGLLRSLSDGGGLYFTFAHWYTPDGRLIEGDGLEPDVEVLGAPGPSGDPQLDKAVELVGERIAAGRAQAG